MLRPTTLWVSAVIVAAGCIASVGAASAATTEIPPPISLYKFDETTGATTITDSVRGPLGLGTLYGAPTFETGKVGNAMCLNGSSQYATAPLIGGGLAEFTISAWAKLDVSPQSWATIAKNWGDSPGAFHLGLDGAGLKWSNYVGTVSPSGQPSVSSPTNAPTSQWQYVVTTASQSSGKMVLYIDGAKVNETTFSGTISQYKNLMSFGVKLNDNQDAPATTNTGWFDGCLDEIAFWNVALSEEQLNAIVDGGGGVPDPEPAPNPDPTPTPTPTAIPSGSQVLASTGFDRNVVSLLGLGLLAVGAGVNGLLWAKKQRRRST